MRKSLILKVLFPLWIAACTAHHPPDPATFPAPAINRAFLAPAETPVVVEIDYVADAPPSEWALHHLRQWLRVHLGDRPFRVELSEPLPAADFTSTSEMDALAGLVLQHASVVTPDQGYYIYVLYAPAYARYRGIAWEPRGLSPSIRHPVVMLFTDMIASQSLLWMTRPKVETAVLVHEFGHVAGLVHSRDHSDGGGHCSVATCRMYAKVNFESVVANFAPVLFLGRLPTRFCDLCERDLGSASLGGVHRRGMDSATSSPETDP